MKKLFIAFIVFFSFYSFSYADFFENTFNFSTKVEELKFEFVNIDDFSFQDKNVAKQYKILKKINPYIKKGLLKKYKA
jgi:hypothetical protein